MSETTVWMGVDDAAAVYDATMASIGVDRHPGSSTDTTAEYLAGSVRSGHLPGRLDCTTGTVEISSYALSLILERAVANRPLPAPVLPDGYRWCGLKYGDRDTSGGNARGMSWKARDGRRSVDVYLPDAYNRLRQLGAVAVLMHLNPGVSAEDEFQAFLPIRRAENQAIRLAEHQAIRQMMDC